MMDTERVQEVQNIILTALGPDWVARNGSKPGIIPIFNWVEGNYAIRLYESGIVTIYSYARSFPCSPVKVEKLEIRVDIDISPADLRKDIEARLFTPVRSAHELAAEKVRRAALDLNEDEDWSVVPIEGPYTL
jgi:hypothetical protein